MSKPNPREVVMWARIEALEAVAKQYGETLTEHLEAIDTLEAQVRVLRVDVNALNAPTFQHPSVLHPDGSPKGFLNE